MGDERRWRSLSSRRRCGWLALEDVDGDRSSPETFPRRSTGYAMGGFRAQPPHPLPSLRRPTHSVPFHRNLV
ncbi:hypothetical protein TIFTF001_056238 [Ficus carica]|uniref:Uncharacterized protein n=1 Tax=Ficus carica TaxID=3494 RepID=A0AA88EIQ9_FICCA|nr:hypothetical protein TIFTF001_056238 [Ficus carica]